MRRSSRDVQDSAENLLRYSQEPDDLREAARPAMPSSFECAQAVQMFEQGRRLHFGIKEHQNRRWPRLTKNFYNLFSIDLRHANIHQNDVRSFLLHLFKVFQGSHRPYFCEASEDSLGRRVRTLLFHGNPLLRACAVYTLRLACIRQPDRNDDAVRLRNDVRAHLIFIDRIAAGTSTPYWASRSKMTKLGAVPNGSASRNCCTIHSWPDAL